MTDSDELRSLVRQLTPHVDQACLRGQGKASFVFARHNGRAVEISESDDGWWLEFWEAGFEEDAAPVKETMLQTTRQAVDEARLWLAPSHGRAADPVSGTQPRGMNGPVRY